MAEAVVIPGATLIHLLLLANFLPVNDFAKWGILNTMIGFGPIFSLGMGYAVFRYALQIKLNQSRLDKIRVELSMALSVVFSVALSCVVYWFYAQDLIDLLNVDISETYVAWVLWVAMFFIVINEQDILLSFALKGLDLYKKIVLVELATRLLWLCVATWIAWSAIDHALEWIVTNYAFINVLRVLIKYTFFVRKGWVGSVKMQGASEQIGRVVKDGIACLFLHAGGILAIVLDRLVFNHLFGLASFSAYFLAMQLFQSIHGLTNTIFVSFLNHYAAKKDSMIGYGQLILETGVCALIYSLLSMVTLVLVAWAYPHYAMNLKEIFLPLMWAFMVLTLAIPANNILILLGKMSWVGSVSLLAGGLTLGVSWAFFSANFSLYAYAKQLFGAIQIIFNFLFLIYWIHAGQRHTSH